MATNEQITVIVKPDPTYIIEVGKQGPPGPLSQSFIFTQAAASTEWDIEHQLDKYPSVMCVDSGGNWVIGDVQYITSDRLIVRFKDPFGGKAYLN